MRLKYFGAFLALACCIAFAAPAHAEWREARSKHFIVYADMSEKGLAQRTERLERFDAFMRMLFNVEETVPVTVYVLPSMTKVQDLAGSSRVGGFYNATAQLAYAFVPETMPYTMQGWTPETILHHEYAHHMLLGGTDRYIPGWASEGLAEFFMTARLERDGSITVGVTNASRGREILGMNRWSVEDLLTSDNREVKGDEVLQKYTRGWTMIHYLWMSGKRPGEYVDFIDRLNKTGNALEAGREAFGDLDKLNRELNAYVQTSAFPISKFAADQIKAPTELAIRTLGKGEVDILKYRMQSLVGVDEKTAPKLAEQARPVGAQYPNDPFVQRAMAEIEYDAQDYVAADLAADRALAADPNNLMAMVYKGRVAVQKALDPEGDHDWGAARRWFRRANRADPNHPLPFVLYYDSYVAAGEVPPEDAVAGLYRAVVLMPQDLSLRARATVELIRDKDFRLARYVLAAAAFNPHVEQENPMRDLVAEMDKEQDAEVLLKWIDEKRFDDRYNEFLAAAVAREDAEKAKQEGEEGKGD